MLLPSCHCSDAMATFGWGYNAGTYSGPHIASAIKGWMAPMSLWLEMSYGTRVEAASRLNLGPPRHVNQLAFVLASGRFGPGFYVVWSFFWKFWIMILRSFGIQVELLLFKPRRLRDSKARFCDFLEQEAVEERGAQPGVLLFFVDIDICLLGCAANLAPCVVVISKYSQHMFAAARTFCSKNLIVFREHSTMKIRH